MPTITKTCMLIMLMISQLPLFARQQNITGKITDSKDNTPISGVSVRVKDSRTGTTTSQEGIFRIQAKPGDILEISMVGYKPTTATVGNETNLTISLELSTAELLQIVLV